MHPFIAIWHTRPKRGYDSNGERKLTSRRWLARQWRREVKAAAAATSLPFQPAVTNAAATPTQSPASTSPFVQSNSEELTTQTTPACVLATSAPTRTQPTSCARVISRPELLISLPSTTPHRQNPLQSPQHARLHLRQQPRKPTQLPTPSPCPKISAPSSAVPRVPSVPTLLRNVPTTPTPIASNPSPAFPSTYTIQASRWA